MSDPTGRHSDHDGACGYRRSRVSRGLLPTLLVLFLVPVILVLKVPTATTSSIPCDCETCHIDPHAGGFTGCGSCHASPPATGSHRVHFDNVAPVDALQYGGTTARSADNNYVFDCGNCHPLDSAKHRNGTVDVELYNPSAPAESLKAKNPASAAYDNLAKTCGNVYCHSGISVTSGPVGAPLTSPPNTVPPGYTLWQNYIMDPTGSNLTYAPYDVYFERAYQTTTAWINPGVSTCAGCHAFPITTVYPQNQAGVGDSHAWLDSWGYQYGHAWNMTGEGVPCATCHFSSVYHRDRVPQSTTPPLTPPLEATVTDPTGSFNTYFPVDIKNRSIHVNGRPEVAFDNGYLYYGSPTNWQLRTLSSATYDPLTKTCGNVGCHFGTAVSTSPGHSTTPLQQQYPKWGQPYRAEWGSAECNLCHRY